MPFLAKRLGLGKALNGWGALKITAPLTTVNDHRFYSALGFSELSGLLRKRAAKLPIGPEATYAQARVKSMISG